MSTYAPLTLSPPGIREVVNEARAEEFINHWSTQIASYKNNTTAALLSRPICDRVILTDKSYTAEAALAIASFLTKEWSDGSPPLCLGVKYVDLSDIIASRMEEEALTVLTTICDAFKCSSLVEVNLSDNAMGCKGVLACSSVLAAQWSSLESLSLCNNGLSEASMNDVADMLCASSQGDKETKDGGTTCERLTKLHFHNNMSGDGGCEAFARIISNCTSCLKDLRFSGTRAGRKGSLVIASALDGMGDQIRNIQRLDLVDNSFGTDGGVILARALRNCPSLTYVNLRDCVFGDDSTATICRALWMTDSPIEHLDLSGNDITKKGAKPIADLVRELKVLRVLHLEDNELTSYGVAKIAKVLGTQLEEIKLNSNEIGSSGVHALLNAHELNCGFPVLKSIDIDGNAIPKAETQMLQDVFGDKLVEMEDNEDEDDGDDDLSDEEEEEEIDIDVDLVDYGNECAIDDLTNNLKGLMSKTPVS